MPGQVPPLTDERDLLLAYVAQQRDGLRHAAFGLTDEQAGLTPTTSSLSVGGLIKHVTAMERSWLDLILQRPPAEDQEQAYGEDFRFAAGDSLADLLARFDEQAKQTEEAVADLDLGAAVPVPRGVPWFPDDVEAWSVRWVLLHLIEEIGRHAGHADIIREALDGATMYPLLAAAEGWPATDWLTPWSPST
jgi:uncharacterized damage-inducible protein DinB